MSNIDWFMVIVSVPIVFTILFFSFIIFLWISGRFAGKLEDKMRKDDREAKRKRKK